MLDWWHFFKNDVCQNAIITWIQRTAGFFANFIYFALQHMTKTFIDRWYLDSFINGKRTTCISNCIACTILRYFWLMKIRKTHSSLQNRYYMLLIRRKFPCCSFMLFMVNKGRSLANWTGKVRRWHYTVRTWIGETLIDTYFCKTSCTSLLVCQPIINSMYLFQIKTISDGMYLPFTYSVNNTCYKVRSTKK